MQFHIDSMNGGGSARKIAFQVEGMDCASCVAKIETALARMPGVSDIRLNFATERLELALSPSSTTQVGDIEKAIQSLGFGVSGDTSSNTTSGSHDYDEPVVPQKRWWQTKKGKQVVGLGVLMGAAYVLALLVPQYGAWLFAAAVV